MRSLFFWSASTCIVLCGAFLSPTLPSTCRSVTQNTPSSFATVSSALDVKKRRRRRDPETEGSSENESTSSSPSSSGELPDFELDDEEEPKPKKKVTITNPDEITAAMMGSSDGPVRSIKDLLSDRALESKFEFDDVEEAGEALPDLLALSRDEENVPVGKKKARQAERKAAALAAKGSEENDLFSNLPFVTNEKGEVSGVKVLEAGAWAGIFLLIAWEVYLNSPFFDRAAPMAPVVFESLVL